ncbi:MAG: CBU_0592 family membrane protein [Candidatus Nanopelagicales bacterium]
MSIVWEILGWAATVLLVGAYALVATHRLDARSTTYHVLNVIGAAGLVSYSIYKLAWPQVALNVFWGAVGVIGILMAIRVARSARKGSAAAGPSFDESGVREG